MTLQPDNTVDDLVPRSWRCGAFDERRTVGIHQLDPLT